MKKARFLSAFLVAACALLPLKLSCAQDEPRRPDSAKVSGNVYANTFFGFTYRFPENWLVQGETTIQRVMETGQEIVGGDDPARRAVARAAVKHTFTLLMATEFQPGSPTEAFNSSVTIAAEDVSGLPGIQTGKDYVFYLLRGLKGLPLQYESLGDVTEVNVGARKFYRVDFKVTAVGRALYQTYFVTVLKGFALGWIFTTDTEEKREALLKSLQTLEFQEEPALLGKP